MEIKDYVNQLFGLQHRRGWMLTFGLRVTGNRDMITTKDLYDIIGNKINNEDQKALIWNCFPPQIAERMCAAIDGQEK